MASPDWFPVEPNFAGDEHLDEDYVSTYDAKAGTNPADDLSVLLALGLNNNHTLIDLGAGTGNFALAAAHHCQRVVAVDISPAMINVLNNKLAQQSVTNVKGVQGGFLTYQHEGDPADFVYSRHALHHLPDFWKVVALQRIADMLKFGGVLVLRDLVYSFEPEETETVLESWFANAPDDPQAGWTRKELEQHVREEHSPYAWLLETMLERTGFQIQSVEHATSRVHSAYVCVKK